jgi:5-methylcytosine-specific restriction endonuclease McrA
MEGLEVHHIKRRSQLGGDVMHNSITLCVGCHRKCHGGTSRRNVTQQL